jgi:hypothetical protein
MLDGKTQNKNNKNNNEQATIYNENKKREKITGRIEGVPEYVTQFIENDLRGRKVTSNDTPGWALRKKSDRKNMEPTPRTGNTIPGNQISKQIRPRTNN